MSGKQWHVPDVKVDPGPPVGGVGSHAIPEHFHNVKTSAGPPTGHAIPSVAIGPGPPVGHAIPEHIAPNQTASASQPPPQHYPDMGVKLTRGTSCVLCQQRKVRCDKNKPCANCVKARVECRVVPPQPPRRRKKRLQEKDLVDRLKKYEVLLSENNIEFESIATELLPGGGVRRTGDVGMVGGGEGLDEVADLEVDFEGLRTSPGSSTTPSVGSGRRSHSEKPHKWFPFHKEFRASEELLRDSSDEDEVDGSAIHQVFDKMYENQDGFPFIVGARSISVTHLHPSPIHIFQLWQTYINNINPLLRLTHVPTVQGQVIAAAPSLEKTPRGLEALMFSIYLMALISLEDSEVQGMFGEPRMQVVSKFHLATQQALVNAGLMRTNDISVLQAYILYLIAARQFMDPRQIFCLLSIAVRVGQRMGLHRDPALFGHTPFEVEQRRRLWWTIVAYDGRIGEMTGSTVTAISSGSDTRLPLNINDTDLHIDGKEAPTPHSGPTEMLFCLTRLEVSLVVRSDSQRDAPIRSGDPTALGTTTPTNSAAGNSNTGPTAAPPPPRPIPTLRVANQDGLSYTPEGFCAHIENQYLRHCDEKIPLHFFTLTMTRQALCKMRIMGFLTRLNHGILSLPGEEDGDGTPSQEAPHHHPLNDAERESLFNEAIQMVEYDNVLQAAETLRGYRWYTYMHFPVPAYMFLVTELRRRTVGPVVERAWVAVSENYERRGASTNNLHNPMHAAFGRLFVKAWGAREAGLRGLGRVEREPGWIQRLRIQAERRGRRREARGPGSSLASGEGGNPVEDGYLTPMGSQRAGDDGLAMAGAQVPAQGPGSGGGGGVGAAAGARAGTDFVDMDWSYIMQEYGAGGMGPRAA